MFISKSLACTIFNFWVPLLAEKLKGLVGGKANDKFIVEKSGFLQYLLPGDEIMADSGFTIEDLLFPLFYF